MKVRVDRIDRGGGRYVFEVYKTINKKWWKTGDKWTHVETFSIGIGQTEEQVFGHAKKYADQLLIPPKPPKPLRLPETVYMVDDYDSSELKEKFMT